MAFKIVKSTGEEEDFSPKKYYRSLVSSNIPKDIAEEVSREVEGNPKAFPTTNEIHNFTLEKLRKINSNYATHYNLKRALLQLGPSGFPFEQYISQVFAAAGFGVDTNLILKGKCVSHEVDVLLERDGLQMVEAKFKNQAGYKVDVKVPLYVYARFLDLKDQLQTHEKRAEPFKVGSCLIVTNTKFTEDALTYATCVGIDMLSWDYPYGQGLGKMIEKHQLHPITALPSLDNQLKVALFRNDIVLAKQLLDDGNPVLAEISAKSNYSGFKSVVQEARNLLS